MYVSFYKVRFFTVYFDVYLEGHELHQEDQFFMFERDYEIC